MINCKIFGIHRKKMMIKKLVIPFLLIALYGCDLETQSTIPEPTATVTRADAETRYAKHCMKSETISKALTKEFNEMTVDRIDGFANGCEMESKKR